MLFPYFLDLIPEKLGRLYAKIFGWKPEGKRVLLRVTEGESDFYGSVISGTIIQLVDTPWKSKAATKDASLLVQLDSPWEYRGRVTSTSRRVLAVPRFSGHGVYRLLIAAADVHIFPVDSPELCHSVKWENMIAICEIKLTR